MGSEWIRTTIGEQATLQRGIDITKETQRHGPVPVVSSGGVSSFHDTAAVRGPGVVLGRKGVVGSVYYVESDYWPHDTTLWVKDFHGNDPRFVYYFFRWLAPRLATMDVGSANPTLNRNHVHPIEVIWPPVAAQLRIAGFLGTLDDKIELNRRMSQTLESMARTLFKSWFVDFDPVRANAEGRDPDMLGGLSALFPDSFVDSELGEIPKGWRVGRLGERLAELVSGARPRGGSTSDGVPSIGAENVTGLGRYDFSIEKFVPREFFLQLERKGAAIRDGDVLLYKDGAHVGRKTYFESGFPHAQCAVNEHVFILRAIRPEEQRFLFFWLDQAWMTEAIASLNSNSAQPGINQVGVRGLKLLVPPGGVVDAFDRVTARLTRRLFASCSDSIGLAALRNALLPKLIRGELLVTDAARLGVS